MEFNYNVWNKEKKDYFTEGEEWAKNEDDGSENTREEKTEFDIYGTALNEL